ncbi:MAG: nickel pincer cofactor biosynthesis protein LarC [Deferribacteres bacterium]|nr:nickel pincer cofactor biosynthesis protein LarC [Deferribacteres bacterium]
MRIVYFDCISGISGDMTLGALVDAGFPEEKLRELPARLNLPQVTISLEKVRKNDIAATKVKIEFPHEHVHRHLKDINKILDEAEITENAREIARRIFHKLALAEAQVHETSIEKVHFHEVGALDSIMDIAGAAVALDYLQIEEAWVKTIPVGGGTVKCAHGIMPVPAPATARLLETFTIKQGPVEKELVTPTGAAILATLATQYTDVPEFKVIKSGYGAGDAEFEGLPNVLRVFIGETGAHAGKDLVWQLECTIDDMNPELIPYIIEKLIDTGALDAWATSVLMKKGRPGFVLTALVPKDLHDAICDVIFQETTTIGLRKTMVEREKLERESIEIETDYGVVKFKKITRPGTGTQIVPEFEECRRIAVKEKLPLRLVYDRLVKMANQFIS